MSEKTLDIQGANPQLSLLVAPVEQGERIVIVRAGKPVAERRSLRKVKKRSNPLNDPLLRVDEYGYDGPIRPAADEDTDRTV